MTQPRLPSQIARDVRAVVIEEVGLNIALSGGAQESKFVRPEVGIAGGRIGVCPNVTLPGCC